jgi:hypothetical protein
MAAYKADAEAKRAQDKADAEAKMAENNSVIGTAVGSAMKSVITHMQTDAEAKRAQDKADAEAKRAQDKADAEAKMAAYKADAEAKMAAYKADAEAKMAAYKAEIMRTVQKDAPGAPIIGPMQFRSPYRNGIAEPAPSAAILEEPIKLTIKRKRHTAMAREKALEWVQQHSSNPRPTSEDLEILCQETGVETQERMKNLINSIRQRMTKKNKFYSTQQKTIDEFLLQPEDPAPQIPTGPEGASELRVGVEPGVSDTRNAFQRTDKGTDKGAGNGAASSIGAASSDGPSLLVWPKDASELLIGVNDTWIAFQRANKGRQVSVMEWEQARLKLYEQLVDRRVCVKKLRTHMQFNGCCGCVVGFTGERFQVELELQVSDKKTMLGVFSENLTLL